MVNITWKNCNNITITGLEIHISGLVIDPSFSALAFQSTISYLSRMSFFGDDIFILQSAIRTHSSVVDFRDVMVSRATSVYGAALYAFNSTLKFMGQNHFTNNTATLGGAMVVIESVVNFDGKLWWSYFYL